MYKTNTEAVSTTIETLKNYPHVFELINKGDLYSLWLEKLEATPDGFDHFRHRRLSLFTIAGIFGYALKQNVSNEYFLYKGMLERLEQSIVTLYGSKNLNRFGDMLRNLEGKNTLSCFSELFLAEWFYNNGFSIEFHKKFSLLFENRKKVKRDFDLVAKKDSNTFFIEVYTPFQPIEDEEEFNGLDGMSYNDFIFRIEEKINKKFGFSKNAKLDFDIDKVLLAVNARYYDLVSVDLARGCNIDSLSNRIKSLLVSSLPVSGIILYQTYDALPDIPLIFHRLELKLK